MNRGSATFLQVIIAAMGLGMIAFMLWEPHLEGRNAHASVFEIYFHDPFLACAYVASVPVYVAVYQAIKVIGYAGHGRTFSAPAVNALRTIKFCAMTVIGFAAGFEVYIASNNSDDRAGGVAIGVFIAFISLVIATAAGMFERILRHGMALKSENDLTV